MAYGLGTLAAKVRRPALIGAAAALAAGTIALTGCGGDTTTATAGPSADTGGAVTVQNCGRTLTIAKPPTRAIGFYQTTTEMMIALGLADRMVGREGFAESPLLPEQEAAFRKIPELAPGPYPPTKERLLAARPDFVFVADPSYEFDPSQGLASREQIEASGAAVYVMTARCKAGQQARIADTYTDILNIGKIFGRDTQAQQLVAAMKARIGAVTAKVAGRAPVRIMIYQGGTGPLNVTARGYSDLPDLAGGDNVFSDPAKVDTTVSAEQVVQRNPEVFVTNDYQPGPTAQEKADYLLRTFPTTAAARDWRVVSVQNIELSPGIRNITAVEKLAQAFFPRAS
ncbi:ABC transporter substrate-binding protein [Frankia sp. CiP3]|uniref:ABC transporter substrate-binding protein n=1 Tax=Frankia sp. CiP3 TaxID=2880971 RepID=UPI001EF5EEEF|nr:ABC transporter substrate-binding protein [Frankia sp. CiP3]